MKIRQAPRAKPKKKASQVPPSQIARGAYRRRREGQDGGAGDCSPSG